MGFPVGAAIIAGGSLLGSALAGSKAGEANDILREQLMMERARERRLEPLRALFFGQLADIGTDPINILQHAGMGSANPFTGAGALTETLPGGRLLGKKAGAQLGSLSDLLLSQSGRGLEREAAASSALEAIVGKLTGRALDRRGAMRAGKGGIR